MNSVPPNDIFKAVNDENFPEVKVFVEIRNVSVTSLNSEKETPAHIAASKDNLPILKYLVNVDDHVLNITDGWGQSVLHVATEWGSLEMVKFLVEDHKMNIYERNKIFSGNTPTHVAALRGSLEYLKYFIEEKKVDPNILNSLGQPPIFLAAQNTHLQAVKYLYENQNADVKIIDKENKSILHMCALRADLTVPKYLMDEKKLTFDINLRDSLGYTVVFWGSRRKQMDFIKYFIGEKHADINIQNNVGWTPFHQAADVHNLELMTYLYEQGANIELKDNEGYTARNLTDDLEVHNFIDNLTRTSRNPRSISQIDPVLYQQKFTSNTRSLMGVENKLFEIVPHDTNITALWLSTNSFLLLVDTFFRYFTGSYYRRARRSQRRQSEDME